MGISNRAYAKLRGVSHTAVSRAIKSGRIILEKDGTIDPTKANVSWDNNTDPAARHSTNSKTEMPANIPPTATKSSRADNEQQDPRVPSFALSRAIKEAYTAKLVRIEYEQKMGNLLDRVVVTKDD